MVSATLVAALPELGQRNSRRRSNLVGVAPLNRDRGQRQGRRQIWGGRADARRALYLATLTAVRPDPALTAFYHWLVARGKPSNVALVARMRKLLVMLHAMLRHNTPWGAARRGRWLSLSAPRQGLTSMTVALACMVELAIGRCPGSN